MGSLSLLMLVIGDSCRLLLLFLRDFVHGKRLNGAAIFASDKSCDSKIETNEKDTIRQFLKLVLLESLTCRFQKT